MNSNKDWVGTSSSPFATLGASNHSQTERQEHDYYATDPRAVQYLESKIRLPPLVWEPCCGGGHLAEALKANGHEVISTDLYDYGYENGLSGIDFLQYEPIPPGCSCIVTNPPYSKAMEFVIHSLKLLPENGTLAMFLKTTFLEGQKRYQNLFSTNPPKTVLQFTFRISCVKDGDFKDAQGKSSAVAYAWFVWQKSWYGVTTIDWIN